MTRRSTNNLAVIILTISALVFIFVHTIYPYFVYKETPNDIFDNISSVFYFIAFGFLALICLIELVANFFNKEAMVHTFIAALALFASLITSRDGKYLFDRFGISVDDPAFIVVHAICFGASVGMICYYLTKSCRVTFGKNEKIVLIVVGVATIITGVVLSYFHKGAYPFWVFLVFAIYIYVKTLTTVYLYDQITPFFVLTSMILFLAVCGEMPYTFHSFGWITTPYGTLSYAYTTICICFFGIYLYYSINATRSSYLVRQLSAKADLLQTEALRSQITPHFLFNALQVVKSAYNKGKKSGDSALDRLAMYCRSNIIPADDPLIPFEQEVDNLTNYLDFAILSALYPYEVKVEIKSFNFFLPTLSLQPFVENAIKHGQIGRNPGGIISISSHETPTDNIVVLADNGIGFQMKKISYGEGLLNSTRRLKILLGATINIESAPSKGTTITITIPKKKSKA